MAWTDYKICRMSLAVCLYVLLRPQCLANFDELCTVLWTQKQRPCLLGGKFYSIFFCNSSENAESIEIGPRSPKLLQKDCIGVFWFTVYVIHENNKIYIIYIYTVLDVTAVKI